MGEVEWLGWESTTRWASRRIVIHDNSFQSVFIILIVILYYVFYFLGVNHVRLNKGGICVLTTTCVTCHVICILLVDDDTGKIFVNYFASKLGLKGHR